MFNRYILLFSIISLGVTAQPKNFPENAEVGKCYALCYTPDQYVVQKDQILIKESVKKIEVIPAKYKTVTEQVLISPEAKIIEIVPAQYATVSEKMSSTKPSVAYIQSPAIFDTIVERILVRPAHKEYKVIEPKFEYVSDEIQVKPQGDKWVPIKDNNCTMEDPEACTVWKKDIDPAEYRKYSRQVMISPAQYEEVWIPDEYKEFKKAVLKAPSSEKEVMLIPNNQKTVTKEVLLKESQVIEKIIPAQYATITKEVLIEPAKVIETEMPAEYQTINKKVLAKKGGLSEWKEVVCTDNMSPSMVKAISLSLQKSGYNVPSSSKVSQDLREALYDYQESNGLSMGHFDTETLSALGIQNQ